MNLTKTAFKAATHVVPCRQLTLFPHTPDRAPISSEVFRPPGDLRWARRFAHFLRLEPWHLEAGIAGLPDLIDAFLSYLRDRLPDGLSPEASGRAADYARRRAIVLWLKAGRIGLEDLPPDLARQLRRRELRALVHEALGRHLKQVRRQIQDTAGDDPVPELLARYTDEFRRTLDALLEDRQEIIVTRVLPP